jgi:isoleucyl-tRNA synthetase
VALEAKPNFRALGKKFGKHTPLAAQAVQAFTSDELRAFLDGTELAVSAGGESHVLDADDVTIVRRASGDLVVQEEGGYFAALDPAVSPALRLEGLAREIISRVQRMRKEAGLAVSDRVVLRVGGDAGVQAAVQAHGERIAGEVLATQILWVEEGRTTDDQAMSTADLDGSVARIAITKAE